MSQCTPVTNTGPSRTGTSTHKDSTRLDIRDLEEDISFYFRKGVARSTQNTYKAGLRRYTKFCLLYSMSQFPVSESGCSAFVTYLAKEGLRHSTIKVYLSGVRYAQIAAGFKNPFSTPWPRLEYVLKGVKRDQAERGVKPKPRLPISPAILRKLRQVWSTSAQDRDTKLMWASAFFGFLRCGEMTVPNDTSFDPTCHLALSDIALDHPSKPSTVRVRIKASKINPFRRGVDIFLGRTGQISVQCRPC